MYHYLSSGLDNVWLANGYTVHQTPYGNGMSIDDVGGLHRMLALMIANKAGPITRKELRFLRTHLKLSQDGLAKMVGVDAQTVSLWERNRKVPTAAETVIRMLVIGSESGTAEVKTIIDRINTVERLVNGHIVASERKNVWKTTLKSDAVPAPAEV
jgi:putative transcriptional regulator